MWCAVRWSKPSRDGAVVLCIIISGGIEIMSILRDWESMQSSDFFGLQEP